jgi:putative flippase GtrA
VKIDLQAWWRLPQKVRFLAAGAYNTAFGYLAFAALYLLSGRSVHYLAIGFMAHVIGAISAFLVYRHLVFGAVDSWGASFIRFNLSQLFTLGFGIALLFVLVEFARFNPLFAQLGVLLTTVTLSWLLHRHYSFGDRQAGSPS